MINLVASLMPIMLDVNFKSQSAKLRYLISLSGRGRLVRDFSLCLPIWVLILNLQRCSSGRGDTVDKKRNDKEDLHICRPRLC